MTNDTRADIQFHPRQALTDSPVNVARYQRFRQVQGDVVHIYEHFIIPFNDADGEYTIINRQCTTLHPRRGWKLTSEVAAQKFDFVWSDVNSSGRGWEKQIDKTVEVSKQDTLDYVQRNTPTALIRRVYREHPFSLA